MHGDLILIKILMKIADSFKGLLCYKMVGDLISTKKDGTLKADLKADLNTVTDKRLSW